MSTLTRQSPIHNQKSQANNYHEQQQEAAPIYNFKITPLLDLQRQIYIHHPCFPNASPSPSTLVLHRQHLYTNLHSLYLGMKNATLSTFYARIRCLRCGQLPIVLDPQHSPQLSFQETRTSLLDMNHSLPSEALQLWRTIRKEMEGVDLLRLRQGHLDQVVRGLREVERLFWESDVGGCGVEAWNGGMGEPPMG